MRGLPVALGLCLAASLSAGCGLGKAKQEAVKVAESYFASVKQKDYRTALALYSAEFFQQTKRDDWLEILKKVNARLGDLKSYRLTGWQVHTNIGRGTYVALNYRVTYTKHQADEAFTLFRPASGGRFRIMGHNINSPGLLLE